MLSDEKAASSRALPDEFIPVLGKDKRTNKGDVASRVLLQHNLLTWRIVEWEPRLSMQQYNLRPSLLCAVNVNLIFSLWFYCFAITRYWRASINAKRVCRYRHNTILIYVFNSRVLDNLEVTIYHFPADVLTNCSGSPFNDCMFIPTIAIFLVREPICYHCTLVFEANLSLTHCFRSDFLCW